MRGQGRFSRYASEGSPERKDSSTAPVPTKPDVYVTAFRFSPDTQLVLFKNGAELLHLSALGKADPERHRIIGGELWCDYTDGSSTFVYCNGEERFRFAGEELLRGFYKSGNDVHTLGQRQGKEGLCYRVNGMEKFSSATGTIFGSIYDQGWPGGAFCADETGIYYSYGVPKKRDNRFIWEHRIMKESQLFKLLPAENELSIYDIRVLNGSVYRTEQRPELPGSLTLVKDDEIFSLGIATGENVHYCKLVPAGNELLVKGMSTFTAFGNYSFWLRSASESRFSVTSLNPIMDLWNNEGKSAYITLNGNLVNHIFVDGKALDVPSLKYKLSSGRCVDFDKGVFAAALNNPDGEHLLLVDNQLSRLNFDGYFTSLSIE